VDPKQPQLSDTLGAPSKEEVPYDSTTVGDPHAGSKRRAAAEGLFEAMGEGLFDLDPAAIDRLNAPRR
jgi:hypothetical protein